MLHAYADDNQLYLSCKTNEANLSLALGALKMQDMKMKDQVASHENAGRENASMKMQDRNM